MGKKTGRIILIIVKQKNKLTDLLLSFIFIIFVDISIYANESILGVRNNTVKNINIVDSPQLSNNSDYENIIKKYDNLIEKYPEKKELFYNLGNINYLNGDTESALENYKKSLHNSSNELKANALYNMGNTFYQMGDYKNSMDFYKESLSLNPDDSDAQYNYELSKKMLYQDSPHNDQKSDSKDKGDPNKNNQRSDGQSSDGEQNDERKSDLNNNNQENQNSSLENQSSDNMKENELNDLEQENSDLDTLNNKSGDTDNKSLESDKIKEQNRLLGKKEAEAILNALKADEKNLKYKKYKAPYKGSKMEKDW